MRLPTIRPEPGNCLHIRTEGLLPFQFRPPAAPAGGCIVKFRHPVILVERGQGATGSQTNLAQENRRLLEVFRRINSILGPKVLQSLSRYPVF